MDNPDKDTKQPVDKKTPPQGSNLVWYILGLCVLLLLLGTVWGGKDRHEINWSDLQRLVAVSDPSHSGDHHIEVNNTNLDPPRRFRLDTLSEIELAPTEVTGKVMLSSAELGKQTKQPAEGETIQKLEFDAPKEVSFWVAREMEEKRLPELLDQHKIPYKIARTPSSLLGSLPLLLMMGAFLFLMIVLMRRMGGAGSPMAFGRSRAKLYAQEDIEVTFDDVAGVDEAVEELREVVNFLKTPDRYQRLGGRIPKGVLLVGPPGTGKTLLAKAIAGEAGVPFFSLSGSDFVEMFVGVGAARVRDMFQQAEQRAPCIIFIDELDAIGKTRGSGQPGGHEERDQTLNALLVEMDGFGTNSGIIVLAATNRPETLDAALLRPGRFDRHVLVDRPDVAGREDILNVHLQNIRVGDDVEVKHLAAISSGFVGADLANMVNEAALLAARSNGDSVGMAELNEAIERTSAGLEKKKKIMAEDEKLRVAYHESGHALVACSLPNTDPVHKVSIIPRGLAALGYTMHRPEQDRFLRTQGELESSIQVLLAGTVAEEIVFEDVSSGAQNDLERATEIARSMVMDYGMSRLGRVNYRESTGSAFLISGGDMPQRQGHSEETAREIDEEIKRIIAEALDRVRHILAKRRNTLEAIAKELIQQEVIGSEELDRIIEASSPGAVIVPGTDAEPKRTPSATDKPAAETGTE